ncbi:glycosyl hydrolase family 61-domain-containing protein [Stachybotrys elegans]|uniref:lytic cellulose monooxygenase (C4-dehydrogenating) n=1 Tax=Stachybotrys elegans TaxID=80388 RepID=A0A8K0SUR1_9HYPO|nr:glycosyl hydrolase family 61-domain-containing protein [Stachybotrys elegans]
MLQYHWSKYRDSWFILWPVHAREDKTRHSVRHLHHPFTSTVYFVCEHACYTVIALLLLVEMQTFSLLVVCFAATGGVYAHGGIFNYTIAGAEYNGHYPFLLEEDQAESIQRRWWPDPIRDVGHPCLACNRGNPLASRHPSIHAPIRAGESITVFYQPPELPNNHHAPTEWSVPWKNEPNPPMKPFGASYPWPHVLGPMTAYMAPCNGPCSEFDPTGEDKVWFKIYESGYLRHTDPSTGEPYPLERHEAWNQNNYTTQGWTVTIPRYIKPGNYLIRHEIIMLELLPPQFYPSCGQLSITGEGEELPGQAFLVSFPGAYSMKDPGLAISGSLYGAKYNYTIPGPKVWEGGQKG